LEERMHISDSVHKLRIPDRLYEEYGPGLFKVQSVGQMQPSWSFHLASKPAIKVCNIFILAFFSFLNTTIEAFRNYKCDK
jgi:hypothetical protein